MKLQKIADVNYKAAQASNHARILVLRLATKPSRPADDNRQISHFPEFLGE
jgi:hypothetical protein